MSCAHQIISLLQQDMLILLKKTFMDLDTLDLKRQPQLYFSDN